MLEVRGHKMWCVSHVVSVGFFMLWCVFQISLLFKCTLVAQTSPGPPGLPVLQSTLLSSIPCSPHCFTGTAKGGTNREADTCLQSQPKELLLLNYIGWSH